MMKSWLGEVLACPICKVKVSLSFDGKNFECPRCDRIFKIENDIPVMMTSENQSEIETLVDIKSIGTRGTDWHKFGFKHPLLYKVARLIKPPFFAGALHNRVYSQLVTLLDKFEKKVRALVIGAGVEGAPGMQVFNQRFKDNKINMDIAGFRSVDVVGDGRNLPFLSDIFHCVILQGVIEHVANPQKVADEITRVCLPSGYILVTVPWMQCFHPDPGDYQRYSIDGLSQLFKKFEVVNSGPLSGAASAVHIQLSEFFTSFSDNKRIRQAIRFMTRWLLSPLLLFDYYLLRKKYAYVGASSVFIIGKKSLPKSQNR